MVGNFNITYEVRLLYKTILNGINTIVGGFYSNADTNGYVDINVNTNSITVVPRSFYTAYRIKSIYYK